jgi:sec-independent protein translocase protein TatA
MFGFERWWVILLILAIVLIVYGPGKLPEVGGAIGKAFREFRRASTDLQDEIKRGTSINPASEPTPPPAQAPSASPTPPADAKPTTDTKA